MLHEIELNSWIRSGAKVWKSCRSRQELSMSLIPNLLFETDSYSNEYLVLFTNDLQNLASTQPRTSRLKFADTNIQPPPCVISIALLTQWSKGRRSCTSRYKEAGTPLRDAKSGGTSGPGRRSAFHLAKRFHTFRAPFRLHQSETRQWIVGQVPTAGTRSRWWACAAPKKDLTNI